MLCIARTCLSLFQRPRALPSLAGKANLEVICT